MNKEEFKRMLGEEDSPNHVAERMLYILSRGMLKANIISDDTEILDNDKKELLFLALKFGCTVFLLNEGGIRPKAGDISTAFYVEHNLTEEIIKSVIDILGKSGFVCCTEEATLYMRDDILDLCRELFSHDPYKRLVTVTSTSKTFIHTILTCAVPEGTLDDEEKGEDDE